MSHQVIALAATGQRGMAAAGQIRLAVVTRPGDAFHLDLDGTVIAGRYIEVDPPHRLVIGWDRQGTDKATPTPALIEITLTPAGHGTNVKVQLSGLSAEDAAFYRQLWARHLDRIAAAFAGAEPGALPGN